MCRKNKKVEDTKLKKDIEYIFYEKSKKLLKYDIVTSPIHLTYGDSFKIDGFVLTSRIS